jgi:hypothetical protein
MSEASCMDTHADPPAYEPNDYHGTSA